MFKVPSKIYYQVIQLHLKSYSMAEIARIVGGISKTTVHNIIHDWKKRTSAGNIEDIRFFMRTLKESGITIENCIEGFRIQQMLKEFGIPEGSCDWIIQEDDFTNSSSSVSCSAGGNCSLHNPYESKAVSKEESVLDLIDLSQSESSLANEKKNVREKLHPSPDVNPVSLFVQTLYNECKIHKIAPSSAVKWIRDMLDFFSVTTPSTFSSLSYSYSTSSFLMPYSTSNEQSFADTPEYVSDKDEGDGDSNSHVNSITPYSQHTSFSNVQMDPSANLIDVPLVSKIPFFIYQKKSEINRLLHKEKEVKDRIQKDIDQKIKVESEVRTLVKKHEEIFRYFRWYKNLGQELSAKYNIKIDNEIESFYKALNDFKHYNYDSWRIISQYKNIESLDQVRESILQEINLKTSIRDHLSREVNDLNNQLGQCNQTIGIFNELCMYGFGLKELKILRQTLAQIGAANNMTPEEVGKKFLKDVEEQYDDKVGFENKIAELKTEKIKLEEEVPIYKSTLTLQALASASLLHLHNNGVTDIDIICMRSLVSELKKNDFLSSLKDNQNDKNNNYDEADKSKFMYNNNNNQINHHHKQINNMQNNLDERNSFFSRFERTKKIRLFDKKQEAADKES
jgi:hypothetical protein